MLHSGDLAPLFSLPDADMETFDLASLRGKQHLVLYFYPRDNTPGCTLQAAEFSDRESEFAAYDCTVVGVSVRQVISRVTLRAGSPTSSPTLSQSSASDGGANCSRISTVCASVLMGPS